MRSNITSEYDEIARVLVHRSAAVAPGERVLIAMTELHAYDLALAVYAECVRAGAYPQVQLTSAAMRGAFMSLGNDQQISWIPEMEIQGIDWCDVYFGLRGSSNPYDFADIPTKALAANQAAMGAVSALRWSQTRWCLVRIPDETMAVAAHTSLNQLMSMFRKACTIDWDAYTVKWQETAGLLERATEFRLLDDGTDLSFSTEGRKWVVFGGYKNMPDGEIATAPIVESVNGSINFNRPGVFGGRTVEGIRLRWTDGVLVDASSTTEQDFLRSVVESDDGASVIGEFGIGVNPEINRFSYDILYDEKMIGTVHCALGRAYPECGGTNESNIHWDIIHDMRFGGQLFADGVLVKL